MVRRRLDAEEIALWARVKASVHPLHPVRRKTAEPPPLPPQPLPDPPVTPPRAKGRTPSIPPARATAPVQIPLAATTLDGGWDRRIVRGAVQPDATLDLHGHTLRSAHAMLDAGLERSIARGDRVLLLVTGKPPRPESERPHARGAIRAAVADWIAASRHASNVAALRNAHPRHGGNGALYVIFRRTRSKH